MVFLWLIPELASSQTKESKKGLPTTEDYNVGRAYLFPIEPGQQASLAGTMGELRSTHFHSGIDIRTDQRIGKAVQAAEEGYISRINISAFGYGTALYITHKNGNATLYAHLSRFADTLARYVRAKQYEAQSFEINIKPSPGEWMVQRGDTVAYSGNTGSSQGPHLHFDIRDPDNMPLNPLRFWFEEVVDNLPPVAVKAAMVTLDIDARINSRFGRFEFPLVRREGRYWLAKPVSARGRIGIQLLAHDVMNESPFRCGINRIEARLKDSLIFSQDIEKIDLGLTQDIVTVMDYAAMKEGRGVFNKLYISDGNTLDYYGAMRGNGALQMGKSAQKVVITLTDTYSNQSDVVLLLDPEDSAQEPPKPTAYGRAHTSSTVVGNTLVVELARKPYDEDIARVFYGHTTVMFPVAYTDRREGTFLIDLREGIPDSVQAYGYTLPLYWKRMVPSGTTFSYQDDHVSALFHKDALYDTLFLQTKYTRKAQEIFSIGSRLYPLKNEISITLRPSVQYEENAAAYLIDSSGGYTYKGGTWKAGALSFSSHELGDYTILHDDKPPTISSIALNDKETRLRVRDDLSGIASYTALLNGKWLLMSYDPKIGVLNAEPSDTLPSLSGTLRVEVSDKAGNKSVYKAVIR